MNQANLLLLNTGATFARMAASVALGLWTTRIAYQELGRNGFGAYAACVALISFFPILFEAFGSSAQRHLAFAYGAGDKNEARCLAKTSVSLSFVAALIVASGVALISPWLAEFLLAEPPHADHLASALAWVGVAAGANLVQIPYRSYLIARQTITLLTVFELLDSIARLSAAAVLLTLAEPTIADFAKYTALFSLAPAALLSLVCTWLFRDVVPGWPNRLGAISTMGFHLMLGVGAWKVRSQGAQVMLAQLAGAAAAAGYSIGLQLANYQNNLGSAIYRAARPATVSAFGRGALDHLRLLVLFTSKIVSISTLVIAIPVLLETPLILTAWIGDATPLMVAMTRATVGWIAIKDLFIGHLMAIHAKGNVVFHEGVTLALDVIALALGCLCVLAGAPAWAIPVATLLGVVSQNAFRLFYYAETSHVSPLDWVLYVLRPYLSVALLAVAVVVTLHFAVPAEEVRLVSLAILSPLTVAIGALLFGLTPIEREKLRRATGALRTRIAARFAAGRREP